MVLKMNFRGLMAPVFTPFHTNGKLNVAEIPKYAEFLSNKNVNAVLICGTVGEGVLMSTEERKKLAEAWIDASRTTKQHVMVHVGGTNLNEVVQLARHAESLQVASILCLPDLFFRPVNETELVDYLKIVSAAAPKTPLFYYNYPDLTGVKLNMVKLLETGYNEIPTLAGLKYTHNNLDEALRCVELYNRTFTIFLGNDQLIAAAFGIGFDSFILTALNFAADEIYEIEKNVKKGDNEAARLPQRRIADLTYFVLERMNFNSGFKSVISSITGLSLGLPRKPLKELSAEQLDALRTELKKKKWIS